MKKISKFFTALMLNLVMIIGVCSNGISAIAATINRGSSTGWEFIWSTNLQQPVGETPFIKYGPNNTYVYCLNVDRESPIGQNYSEGKQLSDLSYRILKTGYPHKSFTGDQKTDYFITQMALWKSVTNGIDLNKIIVRRTGAVGTQDKNVLNLIKQFYASCEKASDTQSVSVKFSSNNVKATYDGTANGKGYYVTPYMKVNVQGAVKSADFKIATKPSMTGVKFQLQNGSYVSKVPMNTNFRVLIPGTAAQTSFSISAAASVENGQSIVYVSPDTKYQDVAQYHTKTVNASSKDPCTISWDNKGSLKLIKQDEEGKTLANATFSLTNAKGESMGEATTDENGTLTFPNLVSGEYTAVETKAPEGYILDSTPHKIYVLPEKENVLTVSDKTIKGTLIINKVATDNNDTLVPNAVYNIFANEAIGYNKGDLVQEVTTDEDGNAVSQLLPYGSYTLQEKEAPEGYILDTNVYEFNITTDGEVVTKDLQDEMQKGTVEFTKTDVSTGDILEGAKIEIKGTDELNSFIDINFTSSKEGNKFTLPIGNYTITEIAAPNGYKLNTEVGKFTIEENKVTKANLTNEMKKGTVEFTKTDVSTGEVLEGAQIEIKGLDELNKSIDIKFTSSKEGNKFTLPIGKYQITEIVAPNGYKLNKETSTFVVEEDKVTKASLKDEKIPQPVVATTTTTKTVKTGDNNNICPTVIPLSLAVIALTVFVFKKKKQS